ncbi:MAG: DUF4126 domain-containing protein [Betaproteobacteria bacterium]|nr:DUF4126 domain-containing protein [Betaproteobacteria bacterium]
MTEHLPEIAVAAALAWASGLRLYLVLFLVGLAGRYGGIDLPPQLEILAHPMVIAASGFMVLVEFSADKIPWVDSLWDAAHTFVRIPGGAVLAAAAIGDTAEAAVWAAAILGGTLAAVAHGAKAGSRAFINTSPEPFSNWAASLSEEALVLGGLWMALNHPVVFLAALAALIALAVWMIVRFGHAIGSILFRLREGARRTSPPPPRQPEGGIR